MDKGKFLLSTKSNNANILMKVMGIIYFLIGLGFAFNFKRFGINIFNNKNINDIFKIIVIIGMIGGSVIVFF